MAEYSELQQKFHLTSGTYIAAKIFTEYAELLKHEYNHAVKGETTKYNRVVEAAAKANKLIDLLGNALEGIGCDLAITHAEVDNLEEILYSVLTLDDVNQKRVMNLVAKLKKEEDEKNIQVQLTSSGKV